MNPRPPFLLYVVDIPALGYLFGFQPRFPADEQQGVLGRDFLGKHRPAIDENDLFAFQPYAVIGHMPVFGVLAHDILHQPFELS